MPFSCQHESITWKGQIQDATACSPKIDAQQCFVIGFFMNFVAKIFITLPSVLIQIFSSFCSWILSLKILFPSFHRLCWQFLQVKFWHEDISERLLEKVHYLKSDQQINSSFDAELLSLDYWSVVVLENIKRHCIRSGTTFLRCQWQRLFRTFTVSWTRLEDILNIICDRHSVPVQWL